MPRTASSAEVGVGAGEHAVLFYDRDPDLAETVAGYLAGGLRAGGVAIVIATQAHRRAFGRELAAVGVDLAAGGGQAVVRLDAGEMLARFTPTGGIDAEEFQREVGAVVTRAAELGRPVCVYGEMVQLLWDRGQVVAALELERLWNELIAKQHCTLMCAYRSSSVSGVEHAEALQRVCGLHSSVLHAPAGGVVPTVDGRSLRAEAVADFLHAPVGVVPTLFAADPPVPRRSTPRNGREWRSELSALYRQLADTLERSAELAEQHARQEQQRGPGHQRAARIERQRALRAREAVRRARALASRMR